MARTLGLGVPPFGLSERSAYVLFGRAAIGGPTTLAQLGRELRLTREAVRQIEVRALNRVDKVLARDRDLQAAVDCLETGGAVLPDPLDAPVDFELIVQQSAVILRGEGWQLENPVDVNHLLLALRILSISEFAAIWDRWPDITYVVSALDPPVKCHPLVAARLEQIVLDARSARDNSTYIAAAAIILRQHGRSMHWSELGKRVRAVRGKKGFNARSVHGALVRSDIFVRTGPGEYGLAEWGLADAPAYPDVIEQILNAAGKPLTRSEILFRVDQIRRIKPQTLTMNLDLQQRFYESLEGTFGLRSWLPPVERQTLSTPEAICEMESSRRRLEA